MGKSKRKRKVRIKFRESAALVNKKDKTRVARPDTAGLRRAPVRLEGDNAANFKVKLVRRRR